MPKRYRARRRKPNRGKMANLSKSMKKGIKNVVIKTVGRPEIKAAHYSIPSFDVSNNDGTLSYFAMIFAAPGGNLDIGAGGNQRIGTKINLKYLEIAWTAFANTGTQGSSVRTIIFIDTEYSGAPSPLFTGNEPLFALPNANGRSINTPYNYDVVGKNKKFHIIYDKIYSTAVQASGISTTDAHFSSHRVFHKFPFSGMHLDMAPTSVTGAGVVTNKQVFFLQLASNGAILTSKTAELVYGLQYTDM